MHTRQFSEMKVIPEFVLLQIGRGLTQNQDNATNIKEHEATSLYKPV